MASRRLSSRAGQRQSRVVGPTEREMRNIRNIAIPKARAGDVKVLRHLAQNIHYFRELVILEVFDMFLGHLNVSKVPTLASLPASFARDNNHFQNHIVHYAYLSLLGLAQASIMKDVTRSDTLIKDLLKSRWPDVLAWLCYFYIACFEMGLGEEQLRNDVELSLNQTYVLVTNGDDMIIAVREIPGTVKLATLLYKLDNKGSYRDHVHLGTCTLLSFLQLQDCGHAFDEIVEATHGDASLIVETAITRLNQALNLPEDPLQPAMLQLIFLTSLDKEKHPLWFALGRKRLVSIAMDFLRRTLDMPFDPENQSPVFVETYQRCVSICFSAVNSSIPKDIRNTEITLQVLKAGILTALTTFAPLSFSFTAFDRQVFVQALDSLTLSSLHIAVARQASAELERLERSMSVQGRICGATLDVRDAWKRFYEVIHARREILAQMQALNSTPMSCDNCFRFDERAQFKKCAGCQKAHYCSRDCQTRAWKDKGHRTECDSLKQEPVKKTKARFLHEDKYFLARCAVNDAQHKKEQLKLMAMVGLTYIGVNVDYDYNPPRSSIAYKSSEIKELVEQIGAEISDLDDALRAIAQRFEGFELPVVVERVSTESEDQEDQEESADEPFCIQLAYDADPEDASIGSNAPPVHLMVHVPRAHGKRTEHFVIDDFWEFSQFKLEDLILDEDDYVDMRIASNYDKYTYGDSAAPETRELLEIHRIQDSEKEFREKWKEERMKEAEDSFMSDVSLLLHIKRKNSIQKQLHEQFRALADLNIGNSNESQQSTANI